MGSREEIRLRSVGSLAGGGTVRWVRCRLSLMSVSISFEFFFFFSSSSEEEKIKMGDIPCRRPAITPLPAVTIIIITAFNPHHDLNRVPHAAPHQTLHALTHARAEQPRPPHLRQPRQDPAQIVREAHVEQAVGLVEDEGLEGGLRGVHEGAGEEVEEATGGGDEEVGRGVRCEEVGEGLVGGLRAVGGGGEQEGCYCVGGGG